MGKEKASCGEELLQYLKITNNCNSTVYIYIGITQLLGRKDIERIYPQYCILEIKPKSTIIKEVIIKYLQNAVPGIKFMYVFAIKEGIMLPTIPCAIPKVTRPFFLHIYHQHT